MTTGLSEANAIEMNMHIEKACLIPKASQELWGVHRSTSGILRFWKETAFIKGHAI